MNWQKGLKLKKVRLKEPLKKHTTFKIGGPAEYFVRPKGAAELKVLIKAAKRYKIPVLVIGAGSNILAGDKGVGGLVIQLNSSYFKKIRVKGNSVHAGSGVMLSKLIITSRNFGLSGLENLAGIPGTVGGALAMNAGAWGKNIEDTLKEVWVMDYSGRIRVLKKKNIEFGYRKSDLGKYIILEARFGLGKGDGLNIRSRIREYLKQRRSAQDLTRPSAGCVFKNPTGKSAGKLIDECGLKGKRVGGAAISGKHANFIVNLGNAKSADVIDLIKLIKNKVRAKFHINLEPEIKIWG